MFVVTILYGAKNEWYFFNGDQIRNAYTSIISKFNNIDRLFNIQQNAMDFRNSVASIRNTHALPTLKGTSDIYNFNQAVLLASDNKWNPRPAFQSYQSVTPYLAKANYDHLIDSSSAPDNIFFKLETIDSRYPSLDDGMSWKALLGLYKPIFWTAGRDYLVLTRDKGSRPLLVSDVQKINDAKMGEYIVNPYQTGLVFLKLNLRKSFWGTLLSVFYKADPIWINVKLKNGEVRVFRIIPSMTETGFLLSPLISDTNDFCNLYKHSDIFDSESSVLSFSINSDSPSMYANSFYITFEQLKSPTALSLKREVFDIDKIETDSNIKFNIDSFSYNFVGNNKLSFVLQGWMIKSNVNIFESSFSLLLVDQISKTAFEVPMNNVVRHDVTHYFGGKYNYDRSGFTIESVFDSSELRSVKGYGLYVKMVINKTGYIVPLNKSLLTN